jgi:hypothetical protein
MWDVDAAVRYLDANAELQSVGWCARYVCRAIAAGGVSLVLRECAKDYGPSLLAAGFKRIGVDAAVANCKPQKGDVGVVQPIAGCPHGHMAMFNGAIWVSDFKQDSSVYPDIGWRRMQPSFAIYRYVASA